MEKISECTITTDKFRLLPKSPAKRESTFTDKIKPVTVLDSELLKATIRFEENQNKIQYHQEANPWTQMDSNVEKEDIRIFGNHTIFVHSISMFLILSLLLLLLAICVMNFLHYTPKFLQEHLLSFDGSTASFNDHPEDQDTALNEEGDFTDNRNSLVR